MFLNHLKLPSKMKLLLFVMVSIGRPFSFST